MGVPLSHPFLFGIFLINHEAIGVLHLSPYDPVIQHRICFQGAASWSSPFTSRIQQKIHNEPWDNDWRWFDFFEPGWNFRNMFGIPYQVPRFLGCASYSKGFPFSLLSHHGRPTAPVLWTQLLGHRPPPSAKLGLGVHGSRRPETEKNPLRLQYLQSESNRNPRIWMSFCLMLEPIRLKTDGFLWICDSSWLSGILSSINTLHFFNTDGLWQRWKIQGLRQIRIVLRSRLMDMGHMGVLLVDLYQLSNNSHYQMNHIIWIHMISDMDALWYSHSTGWSPNW